MRLVSVRWPISRSKTTLGYFYLLLAVISSRIEFVLRIATYNLHAPLFFIFRLNPPPSLFFFFPINPIQKTYTESHWFSSAALQWYQTLLAGLSGFSTPGKMEQVMKNVWFLSFWVVHRLYALLSEPWKKMSREIESRNRDNAFSSFSSHFLNLAYLTCNSSVKNQYG